VFIALRKCGLLGKISASVLQERECIPPRLPLDSSSLSSESILFVTGLVEIWLANDGVLWSVLREVTSCLALGLSLGAATIKAFMDSFQAT
jgi:hypothetical protein